jgi:hypothetical protein
MIWLGVQSMAAPTLSDSSCALRVQVASGFIQGLVQYSPRRLKSEASQFGKGQPDQNMQPLRVRFRRVPLCYSRQPTSDVLDEARIGLQSSAVLVASTVVMCAAAAFLVVYGGWGS